MTPHPAVLFAALVLLGGCATATEAETTSPPQPTQRPIEAPKPTNGTQTPPNTENGLYGPATATAVADPVVERTTLPPPDPCGPDAHNYVNGLPYQRANPQPATDAYHTVATCLQWPPDIITKWEPFIIGDILPGESDYCPFRVGGDWVGPNCEVITVGHASDSGFGQLISLWYDHDGYLCVNFGYCSQASIIATPWDSMQALLLAVMWDGRGPWSYSDSAKEHHPLWSTVPRYWP